jgi:glc operon protein GlcG
MEGVMNIFKISLVVQALSFSVGAGTAHAQLVRKTSLMPGCAPNAVVAARQPQSEEWVMARAGAASGPAEETPAVPTYFERARVDDAFSKGGVLFDGNHGTLNYTIHAGRRVAPGQVETHLKDTDIIYVLQGAATFVTGGTSLDARNKTPDELLGSSIKGGDTWQLKKGDVIIVPKGVPHWFKQVQGPVLYFVVKVR